MFDQVTTQLSAEDEIFPAQLHRPHAISVTKFSKVWRILSPAVELACIRGKKLK